MSEFLLLRVCGESRGFSPDPGEGDELLTDVDKDAWVRGGISTGQLDGRRRSSAGSAHGELVAGH